MKKMNKFVLSTLVAAAAMTSTAWAEGASVMLKDSSGKTIGTFTTVKDALSGAIESGESDVTFVLGGETNSSTKDSFSLYNQGAFDNVTIKQLDSNTPFYVDEMYEGKRTSEKGGTVYDSVNLAITGQWITEDDVVLKNNSLITRTNDVKNFFLGNVSIEAGSKFISQIDEIWAEFSVDGGLKNGKFSEQACYKTVYVDLKYGGEINLKNGAYMLVSSGEGGKLTLVNGGVSMDASKLEVYDTTTVGATESATSNVSLTNGSEMRSKVLNIVNGGVSIVDSKLTAASITNNGTLTVSGTSKFNTDNMTSSTDLLFGGADEKSNLEIGSVSGQGMSVTASRVNLYKANITLTDNVTVSTTGALSKIQDSVVDMNGKTLTFNGFTVLDGYAGISTMENGHGVTLKNGEFKVNTNHLCFQGYNHVVSEDALVTVDGSAYNSSMVNVYGKTTVYGKINVTHGNFGYDNVGTTDTGWTKSNYPVSVLTLSGGNASYTIENGHMFRVFHETENTGAGIMNVENGASFSFTGSRAGTGLFYNSNIVNVDSDSSFTVDCYYGYDEARKVKGAFNSEVAGEMVVLGNVTVNKDLVTDALVLKDTAKLNAGTIKVTDLTIHQGATLNIGSSEGVALMAEVSAIVFDTLTIIAADVKVGEGLDLSSIITGTGADDVWSALGDGTEFTVVDSETKISYTGVYSSANGGSVSIVPEPSAFGLLAGLGAIALAVSRRRRNCR